MPSIDKKTLEHLAELSRVALGKDERKLLTDVQAIVSYFEQISSLDTRTKRPVSDTAGDGSARSAVRDDAYRDDFRLGNETALEEFPARREGYLEVPKIQ